MPWCGRGTRVLADVPATTLYGDLVGSRHLPARLLDDVRRFDWDDATLKVNWALDAPIPWVAPDARQAGTVHLGVDDDGLVDVAADLSVGRMPRTPFMLLGQMTTADPTRSPAGTESAWAYTHLPRRLAGDDDALRLQVKRMEAAVEQVAPGFASRVRARQVQSPGDLEAADSSLSRGALNSGTAALHQQLVLRPTRGLGRPETPVAGLYLASASAHPGGGVHGACGWNAALARAAAPRPARRGADGIGAHRLVAGAARPRRLSTPSRVPRRSPGQPARHPTRKGCRVSRRCRRATRGGDPRR